jgi:hypothetical protein
MRLALIALAGVLPVAAHAADLEVRFCPAKSLHAYPLNDARGVQGLLLQNLAVLNTGATPALCLFKKKHPTTHY